MPNTAEVKLMDVRDLAMSTASDFMHHAEECKEVRLRSEKAQADLKDQITKVDTKVSTSSQAIFAKIDSTKELTDARITAAKESLDAKITSTKEATEAKISAATSTTETKIGALSDKVGALQYKMALIFGLLMGAKEGIVALINHGIK